jgi:hypothetical protein
MGRWGGYGRQTVEALPCIEIGALRRAGYIGKVPGNWWVHRERLSRKGIQPNHWTDSFVSLDGEALQVTWMPWHFGGCRAYFLCACGRTVEKLYAPRGRLWRCRHCHDLSYESRQTAPHYRQLVKAQKIRERLAGSRNMLVEFPPKPKGMHWRRYYRLKAAHDQAANCSFGVLAGYFRGLRARIQRAAR